MENTTFFSATLWLNSTAVLGIIYALYLFSKTDYTLVKEKNITFIPILIIIISILYIGTRPLWCYTDTALYTTIFKLVQTGIWNQLPGATQEPLWAFIEYLCIDITTASNWLLIIATIYIGGISIATYRWLPHHFFIITIFVINSLSFFGYATNTIRNGMACSIAMIGLSYAYNTRKNYLTALLLLLASYNIHNSTILISVASIISFFYKRTKIYITIWLICIVLSLIFQGQLKTFVSSIIEIDRLNSYLSIEDSYYYYKQGFRWDFILYSSLPILIGTIVMSKKLPIDDTYTNLLNTYIICNSFWVLINTAAYSDRFAYLSWFLYPILIVYPFCKFRLFKKQGFVLGIMLIANIILRYIL